MRLVGENISNDLSTLPKYEAYFGEGDTGELRLYVSEFLTDNAIQQLEDEIIAKGVVLTEPITQDARIVVIKFKKMIAPLLIIVGAVVAIGAGILGWQVFKTTQMGVPIWVWVVGGSALLYLLLREPVKAATPYAIRAGKVYVGKRYGKWLED